MANLHLWAGAAEMELCNEDLELENITEIRESSSFKAGLPGRGYASHDTFLATELHP